MKIFDIKPDPETRDGFLVTVSIANMAPETRKVDYFTGKLAISAIKKGRNELRRELYNIMTMDRNSEDGEF